MTKINENIVKETQHILKVVQLIETKINANIEKKQIIKVMQLIDKINANIVKRNTTYKWILCTEDLNWDKK